MGKYLKSFNSHSEYQQYIQSNDKVLPNVSYCKDNDEVHYNPWVETRVVAKFNVTDTSSATDIMYNDATSQFSEIEIDGVVQPSVVSSYTFDTTGEHTVKYTLSDPTCIGEGAFYGCYRLTDITICSSVTYIEDDAFYYCSNLETITSLAITAPTIENHTFQYVKTGGTLTVPTGSTGYDTWMSAEDYYLGAYNWTKVEQ